MIASPVQIGPPGAPVYSLSYYHGMTRRRGWVTPCIMSPRGDPTNHHWVIDPVWGELILQRVTPDSATHFIVVCKPFPGMLWADVVLK